MDKKVKATARVQLTVEVSLSQPWGGECNIDQLYDQAARQATEYLARQLRRVEGDGNAMRIVGEPRVTGVITENI